MGKNPGLTPELIEELKRRGYNQSDIARMTGYTRANVSKVKITYGRYSRTPREVVRETFPFGRIPKAHSENPLSRMLRAHAEYKITQGKGMAADKLNRLKSFYEKLETENLVVEYDPEIPPNEDSKKGGFAYRAREESDRDLIIRVNEYTSLTPETEQVWRFPMNRP